MALHLGWQSRPCHGMLSPGIVRIYLKLNARFGTQFGTMSGSATSCAAMGVGVGRGVFARRRAGADRVVRQDGAAVGGGERQGAGRPARP